MLCIDMGQHDYLFRTPLSITVPPGKTSEWVEVGHLMDTLNHGSWKIRSAAATAPPPPPGNETLCKIETLKGKYCLPGVNLSSWLSGFAMYVPSVPKFHMALERHSLRHVRRIQALSGQLPQQSSGHVTSAVELQVNSAVDKLTGIVQGNRKFLFPLCMPALRVSS
jgi:hypothetical protein